MLKVEEFLKTIPVYPDSIKIKGVTTLPSYIGLCEDEKCNISWISNEAKEEGLRDFNEAKTTHNAPKKKYRSNIPRLESPKHSTSGPTSTGSIIIPSIPGFDYMG